MTPPPDNALSEALVRHESFVAALARRLAVDEHEAADLAQETWLAALRSRPGDPARLRPWLARVLGRAALTRRRGESRRREREHRVARAEAVPAERAPARELELRQCVVAAVLALPEPYRTTLVLSYDQGLSANEIATRDGVPPETVRTRLRRGHDKLRERLDRDFGERAHWLAALAPLADRVPRGTTLQPSSPDFTGASLMNSTWIGPVMAGSALAVALSVWQFQSPYEALEPTIEPSTGSGGSAQVDALGVAAIGAPPAPRAEERSSEVPPAPETFWDAVRRLRSGAVRYGADGSRPKDDQALWARVRALEVQPIPMNDVESLPEVMGVLSAQIGIAIVVSSAASDAVFDEGIVFDVELPHAVTLPDYLDHIAFLAGDEIDWIISNGVLRFGTREEVLRDAPRFLHDVRDLCLDPGAFEGGGEGAEALFVPPFSASELARLVETHVRPGEWGGLATLRAADGGIEVRHLPRVHDEVAAFLDHLRAYLLPLPEDARPGTAPGHWEDPAAERILAALDGVRLAPAFGDPNGEGAALDEVVRFLSALAPVNVVVSPAVLEEIDPDELAVALVRPECSVRQVLDDLTWGKPITWRLERGMVLIDLSHESPRDSRRRPMALFDARAALGAVEPGSGEPGSVELGSVELEPAALETLVRENVVPESWDNGSPWSVQVHPSGVVVATNERRVLREVERFLDDLARFVEREPR